MELLHPPPPCMSWSSSISSVAPITYSTKFPNENHLNSSNPSPSFRVLSLKRSSKPSYEGLQKDPKKDLSRILRTEAAIRGVENKAKSWKHKQLWPKAVLEALDDAIKGYQWQNALMVGFVLILVFCEIFVFDVTLYSVECFSLVWFSCFLMGGWLNFLSCLKIYSLITCFRIITICLV